MSSSCPIQFRISCLHDSPLWGVALCSLRMDCAIFVPAAALPTFRSACAAASISSPASTMGTQSHCAGQAERQGAEDARIGRAEELRDEAQRAIADQEHRRHRAQRARAGRVRPQQQEQQQSLASGLGRAARDGAAAHPPRGRSWLHGSSVPAAGRPHSSPLMKLLSARPPARSAPAAAMKSATCQKPLPCRRPYSHIATSTPRKPPWKLIPPFHTARSRPVLQIVAGLEEQHSPRRPPTITPDHTMHQRSSIPCSSQPSLGRRRAWRRLSTTKSTKATRYISPYQRTESGAEEKAGVEVGWTAWSCARREAQARGEV